MIKKYIFLNFLLLTSLNYAQNKTSQNSKSTLNQANKSLKNNKPEKTTGIIYYTKRTNLLNKLSVTSPIKADSIVQNKIKKNLIGTWILLKSGSNSGLTTENESTLKKRLIITEDDFQFYEYNAKTKINKLVKTEKLAFAQYKEENKSDYSFIFADKSLWFFDFDVKKNILRQISTGEKTDDGKIKLAGVNSEYHYMKEVNVNTTHYKHDSILLKK